MLSPFPFRLTLTPAVPERRARVDLGALGREGQSKTPALLPTDPRRAPGSGAATQEVGSVRRSSRPHRGSGTCLNGSTRSKSDWQDYISDPNGKLKLSTQCPVICSIDTRKFTPNGL